jgi:hypothetical protein
MLPLRSIVAPAAPDLSTAFRDATGAHDAIKLFSALCIACDGCRMRRDDRAPDGRGPI